MNKSFSGMAPFSVLMSVYAKEQAPALDKALESVLINQTLPPAELVLVEDGPLTEALDAVIEKYRNRFPALVCVKLAQNGGLGRALNEGLKHCSHEWIARMDSDDISMPQRFEAQWTYIRTHPEVDVVGAWITEFDGSIENVMSIKKVPETHDAIRAYAKKRSPVNHPVVVLRREAVLRAGSYQHCPWFEDYYLWARMLMAGAVFHNLPESLLWFRASPDMFRRRGGWLYVRRELHLQKLLRDIRFITQTQLIQNIALRTVFRLMPNRLRMLFYQKFLRSAK